MDIIAAVFVEGLSQRAAAGGATRIDLQGVMFSLAAAGPPPQSVSPHLVVLTRCRPDESGQGTLEVEFFDGNGEQVARNVQPVSIPPGKFGRQLVKPELTFKDFGTIEAHCHISGGHDVIVPLTLLPPA